MKIAVLSDVHGNADALAAMLDCAHRQSVDHLLILGDLVGYYYDICGVLNMLQEWPLDAVGGNHERLFEKSLSSEADAQRYRDRYGSSLDVARESLTKSEIDWLISLPDRKTVTLDGLRIELCHGSPHDRDAYVYPDDRAALDACVVPGRDFVLMGHTHYPLLIARDSCVLVNPGSIGQARDIGGRASWCWIDTKTKEVVHERTSYGTTALAEEARRRDPHLAYLSKVLVR